MCRGCRDGPGGSVRSGTHAGSPSPMAADRGRRRTPTRTHRGPGRRVGRGDPRWPSLRLPRTAFWVAVLREELGSPAVDGQFGLEFADAPLGRRKFLTLCGGQAGDESAVDVLLPPPGVYRLIADPKVASQIDDLGVSVEEIDDSTSELRWVSTSSHCCLLRWTAA